MHATPQHARHRRGLGRGLCFGGLVAGLVIFPHAHAAIRILETTDENAAPRPALTTKAASWISVAVATKDAGPTEATPAPARPPRKFDITIVEYWELPEHEAYPQLQATAHPTGKARAPGERS